MIPRPPSSPPAGLALALTAALLAPASWAQLQQQPLLPDTGPDLFDQFGASVDAAGAFVIVGAPYDDLAAPAAGALRVFRRDADGWSQQALLQAAVPRVSAHLGEALAFDGDTVLASARGEWPLVVHTFDRIDDGDVGGWAPGELLTPEGSASGFGWDVAVHGDLAAVGVYEEFGRVFVYERTEGHWSLQSVLQPEELQPGDHFGSSLALHGDTLAVGASHSHIDGGDGRVWVFRAEPARPAADVGHEGGQGWSLEAVLEPADAPPHGGFGWALDLSGDQLVVGAFENEDTGALPGAAYVFERDGGAWSESAQLLADDDHVPASFGRAVAIDADVVCVGAFKEAVGPQAIEAGRAYVFRQLGAVWAQVAELRGGAASEDDHFGRAVAVQGALVSVGSPGKGIGGAAYVCLPVTTLGAWVDLGGALTGSAAEPPKLAGQGSLGGGTSASLHLSGGPAAAPAVLVLGFSTLGQPFLGGVLHPQPDVLLGLVLDDAGRLDVSWTWPRGLPTGTAHTLQGWIVDEQAPAGWSATNGLTALTP